MATVSARDRARTGTVSRPRSEELARQKAQRRRERTGPKRSQDAESVDEALEIERDTGRREGAASRTQRPVVRYGPADKPRVDAPPAPAAPSSSSSSPSSGVKVSVSAPLLLDVLIISADELVNNHRPPLPSRLLVAFGLFGILGMAKGNAARPARVFAWGIVVATFYAAAPGGKPAGLGALEALGNFLGGSYGTPGSASGGGPGTGSSARATYTPADAPNAAQTQQALRSGGQSSGAQ